MTASKNIMERKLVVGLIFIIIGILVLLNQFDFFDYDIKHYIFNWRNVLIAVGLIVMTNPDNRATGLVLAGIGLVLWIPNLFHFHINARELIFPALLIGVGLLLITQKGKNHADLFGKNQSRNTPPVDTPDYNSETNFAEYETINDNNQAPQNDSQTNQSSNQTYQNNIRPHDYIDEFAIIASNTTKVISSQFIGGRITAIFGGVDLDMRNVKLSHHGAIIDCFTLFGGTDMIVPDDWTVKSEITSIIGGYTDSRIIRGNSTDPNKTLILKGSCIFGGIELKSF